MPSDLRPGQPPSPGPVPALVLSELAWWKSALSADGPPPDLSLVPRADAAGLQLLAAALRWVPGRLCVPDDASPVGELWRRLGLDEPADAAAERGDGGFVAFRSAEARQ
jgi:hypothetical protein